MKNREFRLKRKGEPLTPETLMRILTQTAGEETAREVYKDLIGKEPPERGDSDDSRWISNGCLFATNHSDQ